MKSSLRVLSAVCVLNLSLVAGSVALAASGDVPPASAPVLVPLPDATGEGLPARVSLANQALSDSLAAFICDERIERFKGSLSGGKSRQIDTITSKLAFEDGSESYTDILQNKKHLKQISQLGGAWSQGEYGTLLRQTRALFASRPVVFRQNTSLNGVAAAIYSFDVDEKETPWDLAVRTKVYKVPFRTYVWISKDSAQILKIARVSKEISTETGISKITWFVTLQPTDLGGQTFVVPTTGQYSVSYSGTNKCEWNSITFSQYHRFGSESSLRFDSVQ